MSSDSRLVGELLVARRVLSKDALEDLLVREEQRGIPFGQLVLTGSLVSERDLVAAVAEHRGMDSWNPLDHPIPPMVRGMLPAETARKLQAVVVASEDGHLLVAMADPSDAGALDQVAQQTGWVVHPVTLSSATVKGNIYTTGTVTLNSGTYNGIYSNGLVSVNGYPTVSGTVYSNGGFYDGGGTFGNNVEVNGGIVTYLASQAGTLYAAPGTVITPYLFYLGPATTIHSLPAGYPLPYVPTVSSTTIAATVNTAMVAAANATNGTTTGTTTAVTMPTLAFDQNAWIANSSFCGSATCTASNINFVTNNDCNIPSSSNANALDPSSVWAVIKGMETAGAKPTVIQTDCQFTWGDSPLKGYALPLEANLAIFDSAGFTFPSSFSGISSGDGNSHQFYAIVPSASYNVLPAILNSLFGTASYPVGEASCTLLTGPDINISAPLTDSGDKIQDFLYTPANVCSYTGNATIYGRVYAGQMVSANSNWNQTFYDISPYGVVTNNGNQGNGGAAGAAGTPVLQWVRQVAAAST
jgi:hypothetical protein